jgi:predicted DNA-binding protein with PD1-like motif
MHSKLLWSNAGERTFVVILEPGEDAVSALTAFATDADLSGASLTAIGAFERATVGWFDLRKKTYKPIEIDQQYERLSLMGDIAAGDDDKPSLHIHAVVGLPDGTTRGGHLLKATIRPTLEVTIVETPAHLRRRKRPDLGIALVNLA